MKIKERTSQKAVAKILLSPIPSKRLQNLIEHQTAYFPGIKLFFKRIGHTRCSVALSTPQLLNSSTPQLLNSSTPQLLNSSTPQLLNSSTPQLLNSSMTTLTLFRFATPSARIWALSQMGLAPRRMQGVAGLRFFKLLGSGAANGFGIKPNFGVYGLLGVWDDDLAFERFWGQHPVAQGYQRKACAWQTVFLNTSMVHGQWDGTCPFEPTATFDPRMPVAVLTRATIYPRHVLRFWRFVAPVSADVEGRPGLRFAVGVGELPLIQQATFSLWDSGKQMLDYAYRRAHHAAVIQKTRELGWYKEEMFARFVPYRTEGEGFFTLPLPASDCAAK